MQRTNFEYGSPYLTIHHILINELINYCNTLLNLPHHIFWYNYKCWGCAGLILFCFDVGPVFLVVFFYASLSITYSCARVTFRCLVNFRKLSKISRKIPKFLECFWNWLEIFHLFAILLLIDCLVLSNGCWVDGGRSECKLAVNCNKVMGFTGKVQHISLERSLLFHQKIIWNFD